MIVDSNLARTAHDDVRRPKQLLQLIRGFKDLWDAAYGGLYGAAGAAFPSEISRLDDVSQLKAALAKPLAEVGSNASSRQVSQAASLFLFRKCLPSPPDVDPVPGYLQKLAVRPVIQTGFPELLEQVIPSLFPVDWDKGWAQLVERVVISKNACAEEGRKTGGARGCVVNEWNRDEFVNMLITGEGLRKIDPVRKLMVLEDGGKKRIVTVASYGQAVLDPLHHALYDRITKAKKLRNTILRGDATEATLKTMHRDYDEKDSVFVSGDYESATDNFNVSHSELILRRIAKQSRHIPDALWEVAFSSLVGQVSYRGECYPQSNGQMMGNFLSFPLLCITNLLGVFRSFGIKETWSMIRKGLVRINGDDIVFRCSPAGAEKWMEDVVGVGLVLSKGKTMVHKRFFSLNSTYFVATDKFVRVIPVIRSKSVLCPEEDGTRFATIGDRVGAMSNGFKGIRRDRLVACGLRRFASVWMGDESRGGCWGSLSRNLSIPVNVSILAKIGRKAVIRESLALNPVVRQMDFVVVMPDHREIESYEGNECIALSMFPKWRSVPAKWYSAATRKLISDAYASWCIAVTWYGSTSGGGVEGDRKRGETYGCQPFRSQYAINGRKFVERSDEEVPRRVNCVVCEMKNELVRIAAMRESRGEGIILIATVSRNHRCKSGVLNFVNIPAVVRAVARERSGFASSRGKEVLKERMARAGRRKPVESLMVPVELASRLRDVEIKFQYQGTLG